MESGDKICPNCAESVKLDAQVCRFCAHRFSRSSVAKSKKENDDRQRELTSLQQEAAEKLAAKKIAKAVDYGLKEINHKEQLGELKGVSLYPSDSDAVAASAGSSTEQVQARAAKLGMIFIKGIDVTESGTHQASYELPKKAGEAVQSSLAGVAKKRILNPELMREIADRHGVHYRSVIVLALRMGAGYLTTPNRRRDGSFASRYKLPSRYAGATNASVQPSVSSQYGALQGPANLVGGCATTWGWIILLFVVAVLLALVTGQIS